MTPMDCVFILLIISIAAMIFFFLTELIFDMDGAGIYMMMLTGMFGTAPLFVIWMGIWVLSWLFGIKS